MRERETDSEALYEDGRGMDGVRGGRELGETAWIIMA